MVLWKISLLSLVWVYKHFLRRNATSFEDHGVEFLLWTRANPSKPQVLYLGDVEVLRNSNYRHHFLTKIYINGWNGDPIDGQSLKDGYLKYNDYNFISVDWRTLSSGFNYQLIVQKNVPAAGIVLAKFVEFLVIQGTPLNYIHLLGFSIGCHVAGNAGAAMKLGRLPRITGLDPAAVGFRNNDANNLLDPTDANFVDILHTNGGKLVEGAVSFTEPSGHVDFYANGGSQQPGCPFIPRLNGTITIRSCSHDRSVEYFGESANPNAVFLSVRCDSWEEYINGSCNENGSIRMGEFTPHSARGIYQFRTNAKSPFAMGYFHPSQ